MRNPRGTRPLLVGEAPNGPSAEPLSGRSGAFLAGLLGMGMGEFMAAFDRANLLGFGQAREGKGRRFDARLAAMNAARMDLRGRTVFLLGARVLGAFGVKGFRWLGEVRLGRREFSATAFPHPTGINRWWNCAENKVAAAGLLRGAAGISPLLPSEPKVG